MEVGTKRILAVLLIVVAVLTVWYVTIDHTIDVEVTGEGEVTPMHAEVRHLGSMEILIEPAEGWVTGSILVNGESMVCDDGRLTLSGITVDKSVLVTFVRSEAILEVITGHGGTAIPYGTMGYPHGTEVTVTITPDEGYVVSEVLLDGVPQGPLGSLTVTMDGDHRVEATFVYDGPSTKFHTVTASASSGGTITPSGTIQVVDGESLTFKVKAKSGYRLSKVTVDGSRIGVEGGSFSLGNITRDHTVRAEFTYVGSPDPPTPSPTLVDLTVDTSSLGVYGVGDTLDRDQIVVTAHYSNGTTSDVTSSCTISPETFTRAGEVTVTVSYGGKQTTFTVDVREAEDRFTHLELVEMPDRTEYWEGEPFSRDGMVVHAHYSVSGPVPITDYVVEPSGPLSTEHGRVTVSHTEDGVSDSFTIDITVRPVVLEHITVTPPTKVSYERDEVFDPQGMEVTLHYSDGSTDTVGPNDPHLSIDVPSFGVPGEKTVTVTYTDGGMGHDTSFTITVKVPTIERIGVTDAPSKTVYTVGETFDSQGMEVTAFYSDGGRMTIPLDDPGLSIQAPSFDTVGERTVNITYVCDDGTFTCGQTVTIIPAQQAPYLTGIAVKVPPTKVSYERNEAFDLTGIVITATYSDSSTRDITDPTQLTFTPISSGTVGDCIVEIRYSEDGKSATCNQVMTIRIPVLERIEVSEDPVKMDYDKGDTFDPTGMEVTAHYSDGSEAVITDTSLLGYPTGPLDQGESATITYDDGTTERSVVLDIRVGPAVLRDLQVVPPTRLVYTVGDSLDTTGMEVTAIYSDGPRMLGKGEYTLQYDLDTPGTSTVTVSYGGLTDGFDVTVNAPQDVPELDSIEIMKSPDKMVYAQGEEFDPTGMEVWAEYTNGGGSKEVGGYVCSPVELDVKGDRTITVTYGEGEGADRIERSTTLIVKVLDPRPMAIAVVDHPTKVAYAQGEDFLPDGMTVVVTYTDGSTRNIEVTGPSFGWSPESLDTQGTTTVTVTYTEEWNGEPVELDCTTDVSVGAPVVESLTAVGRPGAYYPGEAILPDDVTVTVSYTDGTTAEVEGGFTLTPDHAVSATDNEVTVSYGGKQATFTVTVAVLEDIAVTTPPTNLTYALGGTFSTMGMVVTAYYVDDLLGPREVTGYTFSPQEFVTLGEQDVTISYTEGGVTATCGQRVTVVDSTGLTVMVTDHYGERMVDGSIETFDDPTDRPLGDREFDLANMVPGMYQTLVMDVTNGTGSTLDIYVFVTRDAGSDRVLEEQILITSTYDGVSTSKYISQIVDGEYLNIASGVPHGEVDDLVVTISFPHGEDNNDAMGKHLSFTLNVFANQQGVSP